jgi:hypothetical protein
VFANACRMGLEGIVAKRRDRPYRSGRCADWVKVKNPEAPAAGPLSNKGRFHAKRAVVPESNRLTRG